MQVGTNQFTQVATMSFRLFSRLKRNVYTVAAYTICMWSETKPVKSIQKKINHNIIYIKVEFIFRSRLQDLSVGSNQPMLFTASRHQ